LAWYFGEQIWKMVTWAEEHWYYAAIIIIAFLSLLLFGFKQMEMLTHLYSFVKRN
ncbi:hypothetical protein VWN47_10205, partial [Campylobacter jejuni]